MRYMLLTLLILVFAAVPVLGASSYLGGYSGLVLVPDETLVPLGGWDLSFHDALEILGNDDLLTYGVTYGVLPNLEVGGSVVDSGDETDLALNGKYRLVTESATSPSVVIGAFDVTGMVDAVSDDPSFFLLVSKNLTPQASELVDHPSRPFRATAGFGSGFLDGFFVGLEWVMDPRVSLQLEYVNGEIGNDNNLFNAGLRWAATNNLRLDVGTIGFDSFAFGINYRL